MEAPDTWSELKFIVRGEFKKSVQYTGVSKITKTISNTKKSKNIKSSKEITSPTLNGQESSENDIEETKKQIENHIEKGKMRTYELRPNTYIKVCIF